MNGAEDVEVILIGKYEKCDAKNSNRTLLSIKTKLGSESKSQIILYKSLFICVS